MRSPSRVPARDAESGFVLLAVICLTVLLLISLAIAAPQVAKSIQRQKEIETIHRGEQYRRAIKLYYQKFGTFPTSVKQLVETDNIRFLRKKYTDPLTGKDDWKPVYYGHAHVRPLGFFGKPLSAVGGMGAAAGIGGGITPGMYAVQSGSGNGSGDGSGDSGFGGGGGGFGASNSPGGSSPFGGSNSAAGGGMFGSGSPSPMGGGMASGPGGMSSGPGAAGPGGAPGGGSTFGASNAGGLGTSATTFGANGTGPIVGFTLPVKKPSIIDYMEQDAYNKWEFNFDPAADQLQQTVSLLGGAANVNNSSSATTANSFGQNSNSPNAGSPNTGNSMFGGSNSGFGNSNSGFGSSNAGGSPFGGSPTGPSSPTQPNSPQ